ncbi:hypothetical protein WMO79_17755 [Micrococcaceae bacterium Sec7.4]
MTAGDARQVYSSEELSVGDGIEAWHNGKLFHRGEVIRTVAATDLFWILDDRTGTRRLIDTQALLILRAEAPAATHGSATLAAEPGRPASGAAEPGRPASHVPLFQAPSLVR